MEINTFSKTRDRDKNGRFIIPIVPSGFDKKEYRKNYYLLNRKTDIQKATDWNRNNKERRKIIKKKWRDANREKTNFLARLHIYRRKGAGGFPPIESVTELYKKYQGLCAYCYTTKAQSIDHIIPISRGGRNDIQNLLPACVSCNSKKGAKLLSEWMPNFQFK